ncbi:unnamed protein product [Symbiodinium natans]|uniref:Uncharacterized protein n=1 Tax=Symbiodinium natans TaxID=878477 RepID=A0A812JKE2_9DINO|nr:unnamed protein product [Symbiodinium natans]
MTVSLIKLLAKMSEHALCPMRGFQAELAKAAAQLRAQLSSLEALDDKDAKGRVQKDAGLQCLKAVGAAREAYVSKKADLINYIATTGQDIPPREGVPESTWSSFDGFRDSEVFMECMAFLLANQSLVLIEMTKKLLEKECPFGVPDSSWKKDFADDISLDAILTAGDADLRNILAQHEKAAIRELQQFEDFRKFLRSLQPINLDFDAFENSFMNNRSVFRRMKTFLSEVMILQGIKTLSGRAGKGSDEDEKLKRTSSVLQALHSELIADKDRRAGIHPKLFERLEELLK